MGQAKQRGTLDQRKNAAIERDKEIAKQRAAYEEMRPVKKVPVTSTILSTLAVAGLIAGIASSTNKLRRF